MRGSEDFSIGTVSRLTGLTQHTLRVWERRYKAVQSHRSEGGRRLYSNDDVERLTLLKALVDRGDRIGQIAVPTTVIGGGAEQPLSPALLQAAVVDLIPRAHLDIIPEVGHYPQFEAPEALTSALVRACAG